MENSAWQDGQATGFHTYIMFKYRHVNTQNKYRKFLITPIIVSNTECFVGGESRREIEEIFRAGIKMEGILLFY